MKQTHNNLDQGGVWPIPPHPYKPADYLEFKGPQPVHKLTTLHKILLAIFMVIMFYACFLVGSAYAEDKEFVILPPLQPNRPTQNEAIKNELLENLVRENVRSERENQIVWPTQPQNENQAHWGRVLDQAIENQEVNQRLQHYNRR